MKIHKFRLFRYTVIWSVRRRRFSPPWMVYFHGENKWWTLDIQAAWVAWSFAFTSYPQK